MPKKEIARKISERLGISQGLVLQAVQMMFDGITDSDIRGHLHGLDLMYAAAGPLTCACANREMLP